jgi:hypothetical protein
MRMWIKNLLLLFYLFKLFHPLSILVHERPHDPHRIIKRFMKDQEINYPAPPHPKRIHAARSFTNIDLYPIQDPFFRYREPKIWISLYPLHHIQKS